MNLSIPYHISPVNKRNKISTFDKYLNITNTESAQNNLMNITKVYNKSDINNSYSHNYNNYNKTNHSNNNSTSIINAQSNKKISNIKQKYFLLSLNKFINRKEPKLNNNKFNKISFRPGMYSYKKSNNDGRMELPIRNMNNNLGDINGFGEHYKDNNNTTIFNQRNLQLQNFQMENISNIKKNNNSSCHHINSCSSFNIDAISNNNDVMNYNNNNIRTRNLSIKNKVTNRYNKLNYLDEEQENKNIYANVNKSSKSTKSRSVDLSKYIIKS